MGGWNQSQAHAQFVANVVDFEMNVQMALESARFTKGTFDGCDVQMETRVADAVRQELARRGHVIAPLGGFSTRDGQRRGGDARCEARRQFRRLRPAHGRRGDSGAASRAAAERAALGSPRPAVTSTRPKPTEAAAGACTAPDLLDLAFTNFLQIQVHREASAYVYIGRRKKQ